MKYLYYALLWIACFTAGWLSYGYAFAHEYTPTTDWSAYQYSKEYYVEKDKARQDMRKMLRYNKQQAEDN